MFVIYRVRWSVPAARYLHSGRMSHKLSNAVNEKMFSNEMFMAMNNFTSWEERYLEEAERRLDTLIEQN